MKSEIQGNGRFNIPEALKRDHDEARSVLACAIAEPGPIGKAAMRVAQLCLPHFEQEENIVFPVFGLLHDLASGDVSPEMADVLPLIYDFHVNHMARQHQSLDAAIEALRQAARAEECTQFTLFADKLQVHERLEAEVVYPAVIVIGKYLRASLAELSRPRSSGLRIRRHSPRSVGLRASDI